ncbi:MAG: RDD family protein [Acidobacteriota bacterium]
MKCPKCGYLGFEQVERCRNCGYQFALAEKPPVQELTLKEPEGQSDPIPDLSFLKEIETRKAPGSAAVTPDLLLFEAQAPDDEPLITKPSPPRQPLAVRRATPDVPRLRAEPRPQSFELAFDVEEPAAEASPTPLFPRVPERAPTPERAPSRGAVERPDSPRQDQPERASLIARFLAVVIDVTILAVVDVLVVYLTMELCGVTFLELGILPKAPLLAFIALQNGSYLVGFTAGGQTLGKMALGIRVVTADDAEPLGIGRALRRTLMWVILAVPAGLGFTTAFFSSDYRGLHDHLAGTRVVRASA